MGCGHSTTKCRCRPRTQRLRRPRPRICLRKGCGRTYQPRRWNQRYCQDPECLREVRRWQAAKRQAKRRLDEAAKTQHAEAERARRARAPAVTQPSKPPEVAAACGHAASILSALFFCNRPGCYQPLAHAVRNPACYCCPACRQAVRRVCDRERKWLFRGTFRGRQARAREYQAARTRRRQSQCDSADAIPPQPPP